jgi:methylmalonyl-CoA mutase
LLFTPVANYGPKPRQKTIPGLPPIPKAEWLAKLEKDLKGKPLSSLRWKPEPGIDLAPFYTAEDLAARQEELNVSPGQPPFRRGGQFKASSADWQIIEGVALEKEPIPQIEAAQLNNAGAFALSGAALNQEVLNKIDLRQKALHVQVPEKQILTTTDLRMALASQGLTKEILTGTLWNDPLGRNAMLNELPTPSDWQDCLTGLEKCADMPWFRSLGIDLRYVHELGGGVVHQLALGLATVVEYLDQLSQRKQQVATLFSQMSFTFAVGGNFYLEMAKFRAFRILLHKVAEAYQLENLHTASPFVIAQTSLRCQAPQDEANNLLRATTQSISAILGGVDGLMIRPHDEIKQQSDSRSQRLARNIHHLLKHEAYLDQVIDVAGGSYYLETLTDQLASEAWKLFQKIEAAGGFQVAVRTGFVQKLILAFRHIQEEQIANGSQTIVGVNKYVAK